jgi:hypothetical protein
MPGDCCDVRASTGTDVSKIAIIMASEVRLRIPLIMFVSFVAPQNNRCLRAGGCPLLI